MAVRGAARVERRHWQPPGRRDHARRLLPPTPHRVARVPVGRRVVARPSVSRGDRTLECGRAGACPPPTLSAVNERRGEHPPPSPTPRAAPHPTPPPPPA